ncbi:C45 family peptidase [Brevibacillus centrosporus]|uniref:C45 family autoproteolytic acyltransferase/hydolase n=1 Tax=Brevibacillus centrosporus TaxID=54910 RepID=UPI003D2171EF
MRPSIQEGNEARSTKSFPFYRFSGTHREIGQQFGGTCKELIRKHRDYALERLRSQTGISSRQVLEEAAMRYRPYVIQHADFFDEEIQGIAEGAGISLAEAYLLQLRAELARDLTMSSECTTFAVLPEVTSEGTGLIGQNADLPAFYSELGVVAEFVPNDAPAHLMLTPAGQVSYIGINDQGVGVFANFLTCDDWRVGFPRYLLSRLALMHGSVEEAIAAVRSVHRASSRNLIMLDRHGKAADMETTAAQDALIEPVAGLLVHSNHYITEELQQEERLPEQLLENSRVRLSRMRSLLEGKRGQLNAQVMQNILRDRETYPHPLCVAPGDAPYQTPGDQGADIITFASVIAEPGKGQLWIAIGPPHQYEYKCYSFSS